MSNETSESLFSPFPPVEGANWRANIEKDLKGKPFESLVWRTLEGFDLQPYYRREDLAAGTDTPPGVYPFRRGNTFNAAEPGWQPVQELTADHTDAAHRLDEALAAEVPAFRLVSQEDEGVGDLLGRLTLKDHAVHLHLAQEPTLTVADLYSSLAGQGIDRKLLTGTLTNDPISAAAAADQAAETAALGRCEAGLVHALPSPYLRALGLDLSYVEHQGGTLAQQIAFGLSTLVDYLTFFEATGSQLTREQVLANVAVTFPTGGSFFMEVAKLRAFRMLYAQVVAHYGIEDPELQSPFLIARTSRWNKARYDLHNNLLRNTTEAISAIVGGANAVVVGAFNEVNGVETAQSARLARNIQGLLKFESYLNRTQDPAGGAYYVEQLTDELAQAAWKLFQAIESEGGFTESLEVGHISERLEAAANVKRDRLSKRKAVLVGVNQYPNTSEIQAPPSEAPPYARAADAFEMIRYRVDALARAGKRPQAFLLAFGDLRMRNARLQFSRNLLGVGGLEGVETATPDDLEASLQEAVALKPAVVVLCGGDPDYFEAGKTVIARLREALPGAQLLLAGKPEGWQDLGVDEAIFAGQDAVAFLAQLTSKVLG